MRNLAPGYRCRLMKLTTSKNPGKKPSKMDIFCYIISQFNYQQKSWLSRWIFRHSTISHEIDAPIDMSCEGQFACKLNRLEQLK